MNMLNENSSCKGPPIETFKNLDQENILNRIHESLFYEIVDDVIMELCFDVHREVKLAGRRENINGFVPQKLTLYSTCPICDRPFESTIFASHLGQCMGIEFNVRNAKKKTNAKMELMKQSYFEDDEDYEFDIKNKPKKGRGKGRGKRK